MFSSSLLLILSLSAFALASPSSLFLQDYVQHEFTADPAIKVPVQLGVMSRCPDAIFCESVFDDVLQEITEKIDLSLTFIGKLNASEPDFGVACLHGPLECAGNVQELCAQKYAPLENWWQFVKCQNFEGRDKIGTAEIALKCAKIAGIDWETSGAGTCIGLDGSGKAAEGVQLHKESVQASQDLGIQKSCTILINSKPVCIRDGSWKSCENGHSVKDFVRQINDEYERLNSL